MTIETTEPFASRAIAGISRSVLLLVLGTFCADIDATSRRTAAMYFMNEVPSDRGRRPAFSLIEFHQGIGDRSTYRSHPHPLHVACVRIRLAGRRRGVSHAL